MIIQPEDWGVAFRRHEYPLVAPLADWLAPGETADTAVFVPFSMAKHGGLSAQSVAIANAIETLANTERIKSVVLCGGYATNGYYPTEAVAALDRLKHHQELLIQIETESKNTYQNAVEAKPIILETFGARRVVLCVNALQSKRALRTFQHVMPGVEFLVQPVLDLIWSDNAKPTLRSREVFGLVHERIAWQVSHVMGWVDVR